MPQVVVLLLVLLLARPGEGWAQEDPPWARGVLALTCEQRRQAWTQACGPILMPAWNLMGRLGPIMPVPVPPGALLGDVWVINQPNIQGGFDVRQAAKHVEPGDHKSPLGIYGIDGSAFPSVSLQAPMSDLASSFVVWMCNPGIQIVQVRIPLRWDLLAELARTRGKRALGDRMSSDALPGFFQWLLTSRDLQICPASTLDLVQQVRDVIMGLNNRGEIDRLTELFQSYLSTIISTPTKRSLP